MCADRIPPAPSLPGDSVAPDDLTLADADDAGLQAADFPNTAQDAHLVLYQSVDGGVELRWHLDPTALSHARGAFGDGPDKPSPVLRLRQLGGREGNGGAPRVIADAALEDQHLVADGIARCAAGVSGLLQAEIGLSTAAGGWVLVARSNRLQAAAPVGASFLRDSAPRAATPPDGPDPVLGPQLEPAMERATEPTTERAMEPYPAPTVPSMALPQPLTPLGGLIRDFPLVEPPPGTVGEVGYAIPLDTVGAGAGVDGEENIQPSAPARFDRSLASFGPLIPEVAPALAETGSSESGAPATVTTASLPGQPPGDADVAANAAAPVTSLPLSGSGPVHRFTVGTACDISAELLVHGSAAPGTLLDLGGHPYRVGAGGRFAFRIPVRDQALVMQLLASVPSLPVESRVGESEPHRQDD